MIPHRIQLAGFLSYKDEQEVHFGSAPLWMLAGSNGSGKSSVFDAVTYALFGHHRGGSQNAAELINKESASLAVEFDFRLDGLIYRIKRTLRRSARGAIAGTQQIFRHTDTGDWEAVPDTGKKVDFDKWIHDKIGLNYETFTSSVLLLQGRAEKLLDARPSGRAEVLAGIVDLERYQRLHDRANARKLELKARLEALTHQTAAVPEVSDLEYAGAEMAILEAEAARTAAHDIIDAALNLEIQARRWTDAQARLDAAQGKLTTAESLLGEAVRIEAAFARLKELRDVLPAVNTVVTMRGQFKESERKTAKLQQDRDAAQERKTIAEHDLETAKKKRATVARGLETDEAKLAKVNARLRELQGLLETVRLAEQQEAELKRLDEERKRLPADPDRDASAAHEEVDRLTELHRVLPILERFQTERHELVVARKTEADARAEQQRIQAEGERLKGEVANLQPELEAARQAKTAAEQRVAVAKAMAERARAAVAEFDTLAGATTCHACGQPLTPQHLGEEKARREQDAQDADTAYRAATDALRVVTATERDLAARDAERSKQVTELRDAYRDQLAQVKQAATEAKRLADSLALRYAEMPQPYKNRIATKTLADWADTRYPERDQLIELRDDARNLDAAKRHYREAQDAAAKANQLRAKAEAARSTLARLREGQPAADLARLRTEYASLQADETSLLSGIKAAKLSLAQADTETDKLGRETHTAIHLITDLTGKLATETVTRKHCTDAAERALTGLPPAWKSAAEAAGLAEYSAWKSEADALAAQGIELKYKQLDLARGGLKTLRAEIADLQAEADAFPPEAHRSPDDVRAQLAEARAGYEAADKTLRTAQRHKAVLDGHREQREKLGSEFRRVDGEHNRHKLLAELLGRDRLQRHLVRQAERQIVDYANAVLDRLSGGQLFLRLVGNDDGVGAEKALDLECSNRVAGGSPINVAFLSGSQRFRVAVSLALAIGQYASRQHRPIESVIIDEGFGCLDRSGRQVMIQELQNLRGHLQCILLVSHQEEFADAFADGYRFELQDGATHVRRFSK